MRIFTYYSIFLGTSEKVGWVFTKLLGGEVPLTGGLIYPGNPMNNSFAPQSSGHVICG
jgi:hypothetical protein